MLNSLIFPGQGSQFTGMGKSLYDSCSRARELMDEADETLGFRITDIMFGEDEEALKQTKVTQPAVFIHSVCLALCTPDLPKPDMTGGHSLGEFSALVACGAMDFREALTLVAARAGAMQKCCDANPGGMAAIIGLSDEAVERICAETEGTVIPANYNSDGQVVISGDRDAVKAACSALKEAGAKRALPLNVGGAFHSPLMEPARMELARAIEAAEIRKPFCPIYQNVSAKGETDPAAIRENLLKQLTSPVRWTQSIKRMIADGATRFTEIGPGTVLQGLVKRIAAGIDGITINGIQ